jgi:hypothetical protein
MHLDATYQLPKALLELLFDNLIFRNSKAVMLADGNDPASANVSLKLEVKGSRTNKDMKAEKGQDNRSFRGISQSPSCSASSKAIKMVVPLSPRISNHH